MINHPTIKNDVLKLYRSVAGEDRTAFEFLVMFDQYFTSVREFIAKPGSNAELIGLFARTNMVYSLPFYAQHGSELRLTIERAIGFLAEAEGDIGLGNVIMAVASITGGFAHSRALSLTVKELLLAARESKV